MPGLWKNDPSTVGGKYLVKRRDGTVPDWPWFVLGARDPAAPRALLAYADAAEALGKDFQYVADVRRMAREFADFVLAHGEGDPDAPRHRKDDPETVAQMVRANGA